jgi:hypothetical protein
MHGLKQIEVVTQGDSRHLVGLDDQGQVWFGTTRRITKGRAIIDETAEDQGSQQTSPTPPPEDRTWAAAMVRKAAHLKQVGCGACRGETYTLN